MGKAFLSYQLHKVKGDRHTDRPTCAKQYAPPFSKEGIKIQAIIEVINLEKDSNPKFTYFQHVIGHLHA